MAKLTEACKAYFRHFVASVDPDEHGIRSFQVEPHDRKRFPCLRSVTTVFFWWAEEGKEIQPVWEVQ